MKVALVGPELEENLGLRYLHASIVAAGHQARIFDFHNSAQVDGLAGEILRYDPGIVALSMVFTGRAREYVALAGALREIGYTGHITAGGHFASFYAEELLKDWPAFDSIVHGEGEESLADLAGNVSDPGSVPGVTWRTAGGEIERTQTRRHPDNLDSRPFPTRPSSFCEYLGMPIANMLAGRGCYANCNFCSIRAWYRQNAGKPFRQRDTSCIAREMSQLYRERGVRIFNFHDDNFFLPDRTQNLRRLASLKDHLDRHGLKRIAIQVKARPDSVDAETMQLLREIGLFRVFLGVETNAVAGLKTLGRGVRREQNHVALRILGDLGLHRTFNLIVFDPETTLDDLADNIAFMRQYADVPLNFGRAEVYCGTPLEKTLREENRLIGDYFGYSYRIRDERCQRVFELFHKVFKPRNFEDRGMNNQAMRLDYYFHLLRHFYPDRADARLEKRTKGLIAELNTNSAAILEEICDFASSGRRVSETTAGTYADSLAIHRDTFDDKIRARVEALIDEIVNRASRKRKRSTIYLSRAASAAAVALIVTVAGCDRGDKGWHMTEMLPAPAPSPPKPTATVTPNPPKKPSTPAPPKEGRNLSPAEAAAVENLISGTYGGLMSNIAQRHNMVGQTIRMDLSFDSSGKVSQIRIGMPEGVEKQGFVNELAQAVGVLQFPSIKKAGVCTVTIQLVPAKPREWHMCEFMMMPMGPEDR